MKPDGDVEGKVTQVGPNGRERVTEYTGHVSGKVMTLDGSFTMGEREIDVHLELTIEGDTLEGEVDPAQPRRRAQEHRARDPQAEGGAAMRAWERALVCAASAGLLAAARASSHEHPLEDDALRKPALAHRRRRA